MLSEVMNAVTTDKLTRRNDSNETATKGPQELILNGWENINGIWDQLLITESSGKSKNDEIWFHIGCGSSQQIVYFMVAKKISHT